MKLRAWFEEQPPTVSDLLKMSPREECYYALNESLGISYECWQEANRIGRILRKEISRIKYFKNRNSYAKIYEGTAVQKIFNADVHIDWSFHNITDTSKAQWYFQTVEKQDGLNTKRLVLYITIFAVSGTIVSETLEDTLQHEIFHYYRLLKSGNTLSTNKEYAQARSLMRSQDRNVRKIGQLLYFSFPEEQQAFCNGAYAQIMKDCVPAQDFEKRFQETTLYTNYVAFKKDLNWLKTPEGKYTYLGSELYSKYNTPYDKFVKTIEKGYQSYIKEMGRTKAQLLEDTDNTSNSYSSSTNLFNKFFGWFKTKYRTN